MATKTRLALALAGLIFSAPMLRAEGAQIYPNPVSPDRGESIHIANVKQGDVVTVYNLVGESVYRATLSGNPSLDSWDCLNSNGVQVVTGVYFVVISGNAQAFRVAVLRDKR